MDWQQAKTADNGVQIPHRWLHFHYYEALNILFRFENALRVFVYVILKRELLNSWDEAALTGGGSIRSETRKRLNQARDHGYLGYGVSSPMLFLNSGEILQILISEAYWKHFAKYFKASKAIVETKLQEIGTVRNALAHFRPIKPDDIDLVKQNSRHVLLEVERCLSEVTSISAAMPTNSKEEWYIRIMALKNDRVSTSLFSSPDQEWIRVQLKYNIEVLYKEKYGTDFIWMKLSNLRTDRLLAGYPELKRNCIFVSEAEPYGSIQQDDQLHTSKMISIVFARRRLVDCLEKLVLELAQIVETLDLETNLVAQDNLACGNLIEVVTANASKKERQNGASDWTVHLASLVTPLSDSDPAEFWGQRSHYTSDFIAGTDQYPWMPTTISKPSWF